MWDTLRRWRTWIVNALAGLLLVLPDLVSAFAGYNWNGIVPEQYMPYVTLAIIVLNIWMRPRPAVLPREADDAK